MGSEVSGDHGETIWREFERNEEGHDDKELEIRAAEVSNHDEDDLADHSAETVDDILGKAI